MNRTALSLVALAALFFSRPAAASPHPRVDFSDEHGFSIAFGTGETGVCVLYPANRASGDACDAPGAIAARERLRATSGKGMALVAAAYLADETPAVVVITRDASMTNRVGDTRTFAREFRSGARKSLGAARYVGPADESAVVVRETNGLQMLGLEMKIEMTLEGGPVVQDWQTWAVATGRGLYVVQGIGVRPSVALESVTKMLDTIHATRADESKSAAYRLGELTAQVLFYGVGALIVGFFVIRKMRDDRRKEREAREASRLWPPPGG